MIRRCGFSHILGWVSGYPPPITPGVLKDRIKQLELSQHSGGGHASQSLVAPFGQVFGGDLPDLGGDGEGSLEGFEPRELPIFTFVRRCNLLPKFTHGLPKGVNRLGGVSLCPDLDFTRSSPLRRLTPRVKHLAVSDAAHVQLRPVAARVFSDTCHGEFCGELMGS